MAKIVCIIQSRLNSSRLPNKALLQIPPESGVSMLELVIRKCLLATKLDEVIVVTPDKFIAKLCNRWNISAFMPVWEGRDVLREYYEAALHYQADIVVRITGDTPLIQPEIIDKCVQEFLDNDAEYVYNSEGKYNDGCDVEVFGYDALKQAFCNAKGQEREHVGLWLKRNLKKKFCPDKPTYEVESIDTYEDYLKVCRFILEKQHDFRQISYGIKLNV